ncbi:MAG: hypothetical protein ACD_79C00146G0003 [uncultured bacterium]|nr:MAG: hypothetical protein ACD_79C00146G0003 [uncultured bacterium]
MIENLEEFKELYKEFYFTKSETYKWIFRGLAKPEWELETSLGREIRKITDELNNGPLNTFTDAKNVDHLNRFRDEIKASKWKHVYDKPVLQLGQHYGLKTNLLDWTIDPIIALFFSMVDENFTNKFKIFALKITRNMVDRKQKKFHQMINFQSQYMIH